MLNGQIYFKRAICDFDYKAYNICNHIHKTPLGAEAMTISSALSWKM